MLLHRVLIANHSIPCYPLFTLRQEMQTRRLFGTSGIRGVVNRGLSLYFLRRVAFAIGTTLPQSSTVCIATDTRISRDVIKEAITTGLLSCSVNVVELGVFPTPALALLTRELDSAAGIMVTASHNPPEFNGIKLFAQDASGYSQAQEAEIEKIFFGKQFRRGKKGTLEQGQDMKQRYLSFIKGKLPLTGFKQHPDAGGSCDDSGRFPEGKLSLTGFKQQPDVGGGGDDGGRFREGKVSLPKIKHPPKGV